MFDAFLSCRIFGLREPAENTQVEIARYWSGQANLIPGPDQVIYWHDRTRVGVAGKHKWFETPPAAVVPLLHALIPVGWVSADVDRSRVYCFMFVSPLSGVASAFKDAAVEYMKQNASPHHLSAMAVRFSVDLTSLMKHNWSNMLPNLKVIEGQDSDNCYKIYHFSHPPAEDAPVPSLGMVHSVEIDMVGHALKVDNDFNIRVADVNSEPSEIADAIRKTVDFFRPVLKAFPRGATATAR